MRTPGNFLIPTVRLPSGLIRAIGLVVLVLVAAVPVESSSQIVPLVSSDQRVRVTSDAVADNRSVGTVMSLGSDTLVIRNEADGALTRLPIATITRLEVSNGQKTRWARGAGIGFLSGALVGAVLGAVTAGTGAGEVDLPSSHAAGLGAAAFGVGGALVGLLIGSTIYTDDWEPVGLDGLTVTLDPSVGSSLVLHLSLGLDGLP